MGWLGPLPSISELQNPKNNLASEIYSSDMKLLGKYYAENRVNIRFKDLDTNMINALIATEDIRFYSHSGIDGRGLLRVLVKTVIGGDQSSGGGSTITQQLAKMLFPREKNASKLSLAVRKFKEWVIAVKLERQYTKDEILTMYLNKFDFINNAVGIKSAAQIYFNSTPDSLRIEQSAMLVGMAKNPALFNPIRRPERTQERRNVVLFQMHNYGYLNRQQYDSLKALPLGLEFKPEGHNEGLATYFREHLRDKFLKNWCKENKKPDGTEYDVYRDGLRIYTTINSRMQKYAEEAVSEHMADIQELFFKDCKRKKNAPFAWNVNKKEIEQIMKMAVKRSERYRVLKIASMPEDSINLVFNAPIKMKIFTWKGEKDTIMSPWDSIKYAKSILQTGFMAMDPQTGYIKAWVGGINHKHFKYDHVKESKRQVGSTFKPFIYALAIQEGYSPCYRVPNVPVTITYDDKQWTPSNSDDKDNGKMVTLQFALARSINFVTAYIMKQFGPKAVVDFVHRMGVTSTIDPVPSICLGTADISVFEMVGANSTFANKGRWTEPIFVTRIEDKNGRVLQEFIPNTEEVMSEEKAYVMLSLMKGVVQYGTGVRLRYKYKLNSPIAGKTGTTQNNSDGWFMGLTPDIVAGCWVGAEDRSVHFNSTDQGQGASMALPIWAKFFQKVYADKKLKVSQGDFDKPQKKLDIEMDCSKYDREMDTSDDYDPFEFDK
ncbi:MAG: transglycosylase domain-containing protein [Bacteroidetes bacterium]|nr:transglycosylase domain-containing protein [Bacteroidota bacterium]